MDSRPHLERNQRFSPIKGQVEQSSDQSLMINVVHTFYETYDSRSIITAKAMSVDHDQ